MRVDGVHARGAAVRADGNASWRSGRFDDFVYSIDKTSGGCGRFPSAWRRTVSRAAAARPLLAGPYLKHAVA